jgi:hypothetical protein
MGRIFEGGSRVMNGTRPCDNQQALAVAVKNISNVRARLIDGSRTLFRRWHFLVQECRRKKDLGCLYANIRCGVKHSAILTAGCSPRIIAHLSGETVYSAPLDLEIRLAGNTFASIVTNCTCALSYS